LSGEVGIVTAAISFNSGAIRLVRVTLSSTSQELKFSAAADDQPWLVVEASESKTPAELKLLAQPESMEAESYTAGMSGRTADCNL
jgi:hypothetical protein